MVTSTNPSGVVQNSHTPARRTLPASVRESVGASAWDVRERRVGEMHHASVLKLLTIEMAENERRWGIRVLPRQSVQVGPGIERVTDLAVVRRTKQCESTLVAAPLLVVEILCDADRMAGSRELIADYVAMGVDAVWVIDPKRRRAYATSEHGILVEEREELKVRGTPIHVPVLGLFRELDEMEFVVE
jgi:Uma2 family endonuclease